MTKESFIKEWEEIQYLNSLIITELNSPIEYVRSLNKAAENLGAFKTTEKIENLFVNDLVLINKKYFCRCLGCSRIDGLTIFKIIKKYERRI